MPNNSKKIRFLLCFVFAIILLAPKAQADSSEKFDVSGTATDVYPFETLGSCSLGDVCSFSGTITVDTTIGTITAADLVFPGLGAFTNLPSETPGGGVQSAGNLYAARAGYPDLVAYLPYSTTPTPGSLVGFKGGTITSGGLGFVFDYFGNDIVYAINGGTITPAVSSPEPSSVALLLVAMTVLLSIRKWVAKTE